MFNKFFFRLSIRALVAKIRADKVVRWCADGEFLAIFRVDLITLEGGMSVCPSIPVSVHRKFFRLQ